MIGLAPGNIDSTHIYLECMHNTFPVLLLLWGGRKVGVEAIPWSYNVSTKSPRPSPLSVVPSPEIAPLSLLLLPQLLLGGALIKKNTS